jgi:CheY-like chemotaxis protein
MADGAPLVLVVDDEAGVRTMLSHLLARLGYAVLPAAGGAEGVEQYRLNRGSVGLFLMDVRMPAVDGPAALTKSAGATRTSRAAS